MRQEESTVTHLVYCTAPDQTVAEQIATIAVEQRLAACVNVLSGVTSVYRWQGQLHRDSECLLLLKTTAMKLEALKRQILAVHPYELPEIIAVEIGAGHSPYLDWIQAQCT